MEVSGGISGTVPGQVVWDRLGVRLPGITTFLALKFTIATAHHIYFQN